MNDIDRIIKTEIDNDRKNAFKMIIDSYGTLVRSISFNLLTGFSREDIDDNISEIFFEIWKSLDNVKKSLNIKAYIVGITKKCTYDYLSKSCAEKTAYGGDISDFENDLGIDLDMETEMSAKANSLIIADVINSMSSPDKEVFIRRYYYFERIKSIASNMKISEKKVENILYRRKEMLKKELIERGIVL